MNERMSEQMCQHKIKHLRWVTHMFYVSPDSSDTKKKKKQTAGALGLRVRFSTFSVKDQRRENSSSGKEQH